MAQEQSVLIVDDDAIIRELMRLVLTEEGFDVIEAPDGAAALELAGQAQPALILLDLLMPVMDGWQFIESYYRRTGPPAPIIALTALALSEARPTLPGQVADVLLKPFDLVDLVEVVRRYVPAPPVPNASRRAPGRIELLTSA